MNVNVAEKTKNKKLNVTIWDGNNKKLISTRNKIKMNDDQ